MLRIALSATLLFISVIVWAQIDRFFAPKVQPKQGCRPMA
jgi:hypothetical protein